MKGKTINFYLIDGEPTKRIKCTLQNWTGIVYKIPRSMIDDCKEGHNDIVKHLKQTGIYFLLGENSVNGEKTIYIGQAVVRKNGEGLLCRIQEHKRNSKEKYWNDWNEVIALTTQNNCFGATEISYLEHKFTLLAKNAKRYAVKNGNEPNQGNITEEKESELAEYIDYAKMIIGVLGHVVFEPVVTISEAEDRKRDEYSFFRFKGKLDAKGMITEEGFVLLKGSEVSPDLKESASSLTIKTRKKYIHKIDKTNRITEDILFNSPSAAAGFVGGCSLSGNVVWLTEDGRRPKDF